MKTLTLDFETYYDSKYSLRNMPIHEYVGHELFHVHGCALQWDNLDPFWLEGDALSDYIRSVDWSGVTLVGHHLQFDGYILTQHYKVKPELFHCTMSMARPIFQFDVGGSLDAVAQAIGKPAKDVDIADLKGVRDPSPSEHDKLVRRAVGDVERTKAVYDYLIQYFPDEELRLIDNTVKMYVYPSFVLDKDLVRQVQADDALAREAAIKAAGLDEKTLRSDAKFEAALSEKKIPVPYKYSEKQEKYVPSFSKDDLAFKEFLADPDKAPYYKARVAAKTTQTQSKTSRLLAVEGEAPLLPLYLKYCGAHTFRWSGGDKMNPQNFGRGSPLRRSLQAPAGYVVAVWDSAQIEARMNAWLAGQTDVVEQFRRGEDVYKHMAASIYGRAVEDVDASQRFVGKVCVLALGYGMGENRLHDTLAKGLMGKPVFMEMEECLRVKETYRANNAMIQNQWWTFNDKLPMMAGPGYEEHSGPVDFMSGGIYMPNGLVMRYPSLQKRRVERKDDEGNVLRVDWQWHYRDRNPITGYPVWKKIYGGLMVENVIQSLSRIVIGGHINTISERYKVGLTVHDEVVALIPEDEAQEGWEWGREVCATPPAWCADLPLKAEGGFDKVYSK